MTSVHLYTEDHRHPAVHTGRLQVHSREYVAAVLPCLPTHPSVGITIHKWKDSLPADLYFLPETGFHIAEPEISLHNGTYLCVFKDVSGSKVKKLVIDLIITKQRQRKTQLPGIYIDKIANGEEKMILRFILKLMFVISIFSLV